MTYGEMIIDKLITDFDNNRFSIAFLPYKYAMWDSMETVYDAAVKRGLTTHLMPIPYKTRGDGVWHDETTLFGENTKNRKLLKEYVPDVVVIHYPYDGRNRVTEIDPDFYSDRLKALGCKIVYLAYCGSCWGEHLILQQGVKNADYIFVASDDEKKRFIDLWRQKGVDISKNVFCVGGLPKYEAVLKQRMYPVQIDKIQENIVLICGSLQSFLNERDKRIAKWRETIKKHAEKENTFVMFRPHPLIEDTIRAMLPEYLFVYEYFLKEIKEICYVDKSQGFQENISFANYLISDPSSVIEVWKHTGKPFEIIE